MLEVKGLKKRFGSAEILKGIDLSLVQGDVVAVLGPSGSGKTTVLRCLNYLERADAGTMDFLGKRYDMARITRREIAEIRSHTAFVFQNYNLFLNKTALQNVTEGLIVVRHMEKHRAEEIAREALERVGIADKADAHPTQLSGGQQQRVAIARAIAQSPEVIYLDEPTSALDPELIGGVLEVIRSLAESGMTMVLVTHELRFARSVANKTVFMDGGQVLRAAPTEDFYAHLDDGRIQHFFKTLSMEEPK